MQTKSNLRTKAALSQHGLLFLLLSSVLGAQVANKADDKTDTASSAPATLERFEVTGSRIKRLDYETTSPVVTFTASAIEDKGFPTLGEFVQSLPYNNGSAISEFTTGTFIPGATTVNPRGLGANRLLTLVNGRRAVPYALTNSGSGTPQTQFNFNSIPQSAIERLEFLKDGASAIYGSDAITGVMNIILKKNYEGSSVDLSFSSPVKHDVMRKSISVFTGLSRNGWEISAGFSYQTRHDSFLSDYGVTTTDYRYLGPKGANQNSTIFMPSYLGLSTAQAAAAGFGSSGFYIIPGGVPTANPTRASFVNAGTSTAGIPNTNRYDYANYTQLIPENFGGAGYVSLQRTLMPNLTAFANVMYSRNVIEYIGQTGLGTSLAGLVFPASNPYNPTGQTLTLATNTLTYRSTYLPLREVVTDTRSAVAGLRGMAFGKWNWETAVNYGRNTAGRVSEGIKTVDIQAALNGTTTATALNPFGPSGDPGLERRLHTRAAEMDGDLKSVTIDASVNGSAFQIPLRGAGELGVAAGVEHRRDDLTANPNISGFIGLNTYARYSGDRNANAVYLEVTAPVQRWLEFQFAGRHERYSDFGNTTKPKAGAKVRLPNNPIVNAIVRASYSESFKAPDLGQLYQPQSNAVTTASYLDPLRPQDAARQIPTRVGGNPDLKPEEGKVQYLGAVFEVPAVKGLSFSVDYFDTKVTNVINTLTVTYLLSAEGRRVYPNAVERDNSVSNPGPIVRVATISNNLGMQLFRGIDYGARYTLRNTRTGTYTFTAEATQALKVGRDPGDGTGFLNNTGLAFDIEWRYNYAIGWAYKNWGARVGVDVIGKFFNDNWTAAGWGENVFALVNPSVTYRGFERTTVTFGITNVLDSRPPPNGYRILGFDDRLYGAGALGIAWSLRIRRQF